MDQSWPCMLIQKCATRPRWIDTLRPYQDGHRLVDRIFKCFSVTEDFADLIMISLKCAPLFPVNKKSEFDQVMAWRRLQSLIKTFASREGELKPSCILPYSEMIFSHGMLYMYVWYAPAARGFVFISIAYFNVITFYFQPIHIGVLLLDLDKISSHQWHSPSGYTFRYNHPEQRVVSIK